MILLGDDMREMTGLYGSRHTSISVIHSFDDEKVEHVYTAFTYSDTHVHFEDIKQLNVDIDRKILT